MEIDISLAQLANEIQKQPKIGPPFVDVVIYGNRIERLARIGSRYWFEYHCWESSASVDAEIWYKSHQKCTVIRFADSDPCFFTTFAERGEAGHSLMYRVKFDDGLEWDVFEDELCSSKQDFFRPNPPPKSLSA